MNENIEIIDIDSDFAKKTASASNVDLFACYQCEKCTNGCPVTFVMDYYPHQIIRMVQLGLAEKITRSASIWVCASCETCFTRCPNQIDIPKLMDYLKQWVLNKGEKPAERNVQAFHKAFLKNIRRFGRIHEAELIRDYMLKSVIANKWINPMEVLGYLKLGIGMIKRGRLAFLPQKTEGKDAVKALFERRGEKDGV